jgi:hypothetical protein
MPTAAAGAAVVRARGVTAASRVLAVLVDTAVPPAGAPALPLPNVPVAPRISLPPEPAVEWRHHDDPSWMIFHLDDGLELESWDVLRAEGEAAERRLWEAQGMLSAIAASIAGALGSMTGKVVPAGQVRSNSGPSLLLVLFCRRMLNAMPPQELMAISWAKSEFLRELHRCQGAGFSEPPGSGGPRMPPHHRDEELEEARLAVIRAEATGDAAWELARVNAIEAWLRELQVSSSDKFSSAVLRHSALEQLFLWHSPLTDQRGSGRSAPPLIASWS